MEVSSQIHAPAALSRDRAPGDQWIVVWAGARTVLDIMEKRKMFSSPRTEPRSFIRCSVPGRSWQKQSLSIAFYVLRSAESLCRCVPSFLCEKKKCPVMRTVNSPNAGHMTNRPPDVLLTQPNAIWTFWIKLISFKDKPVPYEYFLSWCIRYY
jgi:hypothetical protein